MYVFLVTTCLTVAMATGRPDGFTDNNDEVWAYQWYLDDPFLMECNSSKINVAANEYIIWETPGGMFLSNGYMDSNYEVQNKSGVQNMNLLVKSVQPDLHGVYICTVYPTGSMTPRARMILGLNIHDRKYREMFDKYRHNFIVAVIATAVFVVPLATICFVHHFKYMTPEDKAMKQKRKSRKPEHAYSVNDADIPTKSKDIGQMEYENQAFDTPM